MTFGAPVLVGAPLSFDANAAFCLSNAIMLFQASPPPLAGGSALFIARP